MRWVFIPVSIIIIFYGVRRLDISPNPNLEDQAFSIAGFLFLTIQSLYLRPPNKRLLPLSPTCITRLYDKDARHPTWRQSPVLLGESISALDTPDGSTMTLQLP